MADLLDTRCVVCVGPGGVGKTSTAAALGVESAHRGRRTVVLTIDPARRLANALGLPEIGSVERDIPGEAFEAAGIEPPEARLSALMLDIKEAWDDVVERHHPDPEARQQLLDNRMYRALSTALAGSQEYMAMEKLHQLAVRSEDRLDCILLDTPPANHAVDFLEAPHRILDALSNDATRWLLEPLASHSGRGFGRRLLDAGSGFFVRTISRLTGTDMLAQLAELLQGFQGMLEGFRSRAEAVQALLRSADTGFVVVAGSDPDGVQQAEAFIERLRLREARVVGVVLNRGHDGRPFGSEDVQSLRRALEAEGHPECLEPWVARARSELERAEGEVEAAQTLAQRLELPVWRVPELEEDVHDLEGLERIRTHLADPVSP